MERRIKERGGQRRVREKRSRRRAGGTERTRTQSPRGSGAAAAASPPRAIPPTSVGKTLNIKERKKNPNFLR